MWHGTAAAWLQREAGVEGIFNSRQLRFTGIGESDLAEQVADLLDGRNPTVAPYASLGDVTLRITAHAADAAAAEALLDPIESELRRRVGQHCYGRDDDSLAASVLQLLRDRGVTLAVAESCTGGALGAAITAVPGSSDVFLGGVIAYSNAIKQQLLGVPADVWRPMERSPILLCWPWLRARADSWAVTGLLRSAGSQVRRGTQGSLWDWFIWLSQVPKAPMLLRSALVIAAVVRLFRS